MPRRDATGPNGDGSGTGRGLGNCCGVNGLGLNKYLIRRMLCQDL